MDVNALVNMHYNNTLKNIMDHHAPLKVKQSVRQNGQPWFNGLVNATRKERMKLERKWRQSKLEIDRQKYKIKSKELERLIVNEEKKFYIRNIEDNKNNQKNLFKTFGKLLLNNSVVSVLPEHTSPLDLANRFGSYFTTKISTICDNLIKENTEIALMCFPQIHIST